jgi:GPH family glycoside/pentoside/hexuronide:cation symporter
MDNPTGSNIDSSSIAGRKIFPVINQSPLFYGLGVLSYNLITEAVAGFAYYYYIEVLGLAMAMAAVVRLVYTIWDSVNDPIFGYLSDNTRSRFGRRHVWLAPASLLCGIVFILIFSAQGLALDKSQLFWYMMIVLLLFETLTTIIMVNYVPLFPEFFHGLKELAKASVFNQAGMGIAVLIGLALSPILYRAVGFTNMSVIYSIVFVGLLAAALIRNREDPKMQTAEKVAILPAFKSVMKDRSFWKYGITISLVFFGLDMIPFALPFYVQYTLGAKPGITSLLAAVALLTSLIVLPLWGRLIRKWDLRKSFLLVIGIMSLSTILLSISSNTGLALVAVVIFGIAWGGIWVCNHVIRADLVSRNLEATDKHTEALYYALLAVIRRVSGLLQSLAMFLAVIIFGYISGETPGPHPDLAFRFLMGIVPFVGLAISWFFARYFFKEYTPNSQS